MTDFSSSLPSSDLNSESESYSTTDGQSASLSWNNAPVWGLRPDFYYCQSVAGLFLWGALSDERTGLSFTIVAGPRQRSHSRVPVPWESQPYFTVSDSRLPFSSPPTTRSVAVEVFDPTSTREWSELSSVLLLYSESLSKEMFVDHSYPRKHVPYRVGFHGNVFINAFPSNGSTCPNIKLSSGNLKGNRTLWRSRHKWKEVRLDLDLREIRCEIWDWIQLDQDRFPVVDGLLWSVKCTFVLMRSGGFLGRENGCYLILKTLHHGTSW
jgi:hypothetical protein